MVVERDLQRGGDKLSRITVVRVTTLCHSQQWGKLRTSLKIPTWHLLRLFITLRESFTRANVLHHWIRGLTHPYVSKPDMVRWSTVAFIPQIPIRCNTRQLSVASLI
jgi:hypothetical protein